MVYLKKSFCHITVSIISIIIPDVVGSTCIVLGHLPILFYFWDRAVGSQGKSQACFIVKDDMELLPLLLSLPSANIMDNICPHALLMQYSGWNTELNAC